MFLVKFNSNANDGLNPLLLHFYACYYVMSAMWKRGMIKCFLHLITFIAFIQLRLWQFEYMERLHNGRSVESTDEPGREMLSLIELNSRLYLLDVDDLQPFLPGGSQRSTGAEKNKLKMRATSANRAISLTAVVMVLTSMVLQGVQAGVVSDFSHAERCKDSLYMGTPPRGYLSNAFKKICQRYEDKPRYATVYDPRRHIPIFSAYTFKKSDGEKKVDFPWMFEPQVSLIHSTTKCYFST